MPRTSKCHASSQADRTNEGSTTLMSPMTIGSARKAKTLGDRAEFFHGSQSSFSGRRVFVTPAEATRVGCYCHRQVRSRVVVTVMKMMLLSAIAVSGAALPEAPGGTPAPAEAALAPAQSDNSTSTSGRRGSRWGRRDLNHVAVNEQGHPCLPNPLWERKVDPAKYEFGCTEIEDMLTGPKRVIDRGVVRNVSLVEYHGKTLVVKTLLEMEKQRHYAKHVDMHHREVLTLDALAGHRNIVGMLGLCDTTIVAEYHQSFLGVLLRDGRELPVVEVVSMALDAARGLQVLHEVAGCLHLDLKPRQLFVDGSGTVMLNDFNRAHVMSVNPTNGKYCPLESPPRNRHASWPSPENYAGELLTEKADIYSLGMIFFALIAGRLPYYGKPELLESAFYHKGRPKIDPSWHRGFMEVVQAMWAQDPKKRPYAGEVVARLQGIQHELGGSLRSP